LAVAATVIGVREMGLLEPVELQAYDQMIQLKPKEKWDDRFLMITIDQDDMKYQDQQGMVRSLIPGTSDRRSLAGEALSQLLKKLQQYEASVIGLDVLRPIAAAEDYLPLAKQLEQTKNLIGICSDFTQIGPPPELPLNQVSFSDVPLDLNASPNDEALVRRYLYQASFPNDSPCLSPTSIQAAQSLQPLTGCSLEDFAVSFGLRVAMQYLQSQIKALDCQKLRRGILETNIGDAQLRDRLNQTPGPYRGQRGEAAAGRQVMLNVRRLKDDPQGGFTKIAPHVSLKDFLAPTFAGGESMKGKIVLIGVTEPGKDDFLTPLSRNSNAIVPGVYIHAHAISQFLSTMLEERPSIEFWPLWLESLWVAVWAIAGGTGLLTLSSLRWRGVLLSSMMIGLGTVCLVLFYGIGLWVPIIPAGLALVTSAAVVSLSLSRAYRNPQSTIVKLK
jgi:CHASE2 domain-containing sensor protein